MESRLPSPEAVARIAVARLERALAAKSAARAQRDAAMAEMYREGATLAEIAEVVGVSVPRVHKILRGRPAPAATAPRRPRPPR